jgi:hypothetical protein
MSKGKQKGHQKSMLTIKDEALAPYYITVDESQFTLLTEGSTLPIGYFNNLNNVLKKVSKLLTVQNGNQSTMNITEYIGRYEVIVNKLNNTINI